jgi:hypothetical protein
MSSIFQADFQATPATKKRIIVGPNLNPNLLQAILEKILVLALLSVWILIETTK